MNGSSPISGIRAGSSRRLEPTKWLSQEHILLIRDEPNEFDKSPCFPMAPS